MSQRCHRCGFAHLPSDTARCANAAAIGTKLATRMKLESVPAECTQAYHERIKADAATFLLQTHNWKQWTDEHDRLLLGCCVKCGSTLALYVGSVVALDTMKGVSR